MCIKAKTVWLWWGLGVAWSWAWAQTNSAPLLSSPIAGGTPIAPASPMPSEGAGGSIGAGAGHHSPNSPFAPLVARNDVVAWSTLTAVKPQMDTKTKRIMPVFSAPILALDRQVVRVQGYMMPLAPGMAQTHFLLSAVPLTCSFCTPGGPESIIEVFSKTPVNYVQQGVVVEGRLDVLPNDPKGVFYRLNNARSIK